MRVVKLYIIKEGCILHDNLKKEIQREVNKVIYSNMINNTVIVL